jgi:hypothetical protein
MRLVSLDIDPQNRTQRIHLGPFVSGLNAVWGNRGSGKSTIARFIRGLLYHRHRDASGYGQEAVDGLVGSLQWADMAGTSRVISSADAVHQRDYRFEGPYHHERRQSLLANAAYPNALPPEQPWQRIGGEVFDAVFCGRLGEVLPERLWQAARELGIHVATGHEHDEAYRRLKAEEDRLQQRLHHLRVDDRDREWWAFERERLAARLDELGAMLPSEGMLPGALTGGHPGDDRLASAPRSLPEWESQLIQYRAELSEATTREAELMRQLAMRAPRRDEIAAGDPRESLLPPSYGRYPRTTSVYRDPFGTWTGYSKPVKDVRDSGWKESKESQPSVEQLQSELGTLRKRQGLVQRWINDLETKVASQHGAAATRATATWERDELQARLAYAEEVLKSWDLYEQTRRRLAEVQSQLRGQGPYQEAYRGSFVPCVERYVRELSAGALRQLPAWALEALRRDQGYAAGLTTNRGRLESYREVYRDYRPDNNRIDYPVPPSQSSERQVVELALRMAILDSAAHRIGRLPLILDDALDGFHGQNLDHIVRVLIEFARDGQQVLLMTSEEEVAERVRVHHGWVSHLQPGLVEAEPVTLRPRLYREYPLDNHPEYSPAVPAREPAFNLAELNAQLAAVETHPYPAVDYPADGVPYREDRPTVPERQCALSIEDPLEAAPGMRSAMGQRLIRHGVRTVGDFIDQEPEYLTSISGMSLDRTAVLRRRQAEARLLCQVPRLRVFDARVLAGCGIEDSAVLSQTPPTRLLRMVERYLMTKDGQEVMNTADSHELARITSWLASARRPVGQVSRDDESRRWRRELRSRRGRYETEGRRPSRPRTGEARNPAVGKAFLKFYLDPGRPVVDAPSIGPRMAERLEECRVVTVGDLLKADPQALAGQLADRRVSAATVGAWQHQASLVCRVPNLRGHDAQMLVATGITEPDQLLQANPVKLRTKIAEFLSSKAGQRMMRGTEGADLPEIQQWIEWARSSRRLNAA